MRLHREKAPCSIRADRLRRAGGLWGLIALGIGASVLLALATRSGLGISPDSVEHLSTAQHLREGQGAYTATSLPLSSLGDISRGALRESVPSVQYAPLYPALIALISRVTGAELATSARYISLMAGAIFLILSVLLMRSCSPVQLFVAYGAVLLLLSPPFWGNYLMLWSETLFLPLSVLFLIMLDRYLTHPQSGRLLLAAVVAAAVSLTRYPGVVLTLVGVVFLLLHRAHPSRSRVWNTLLFTLVSSLPLMAWLARNWYVSGTLMGERGSSLLGMTEALLYTVVEIWRWFLPPPVLREIPPAVLLGASVTFTALYVVLRWRYAPLMGEDEAKRRATRMSDIAACLVALYTGAIVVIETMVGIDWPSMRLLSPVWMPLLGVLLWSASLLWSVMSSPSASRRGRMVLGVILALAAIAVLTNAAGRSLYTVLAQQRILQEYRALCARIRDTYAQCVPATHALLVSNDANTVHHALGKTSVISPRKYYYNSRERVSPSEVDALLRVAESGREVFLIWIHTAPDRGNLYTLEELSSAVLLKLLCRSGGIEVYRVLPPRQAESAVSRPGGARNSVDLVYQPTPHRLSRSMRLPAASTASVRRHPAAISTSRSQSTRVSCAPSPTRTPSSSTQSSSTQSLAT